jgi:hypothetical protein
MIAPFCRANAANLARTSYSAQGLQTVDRRLKTEDRRLKTLPCKNRQPPRSQEQEDT